MGNLTRMTIEIGKGQEDPLGLTRTRITDPRVRLLAIANEVGGANLTNGYIEDADPSAFKKLELARAAVLQSPLSRHVSVVPVE